uniref:Secreted protein n=1 Tax=Vitis vinifera TaxID=29760 RepID=F6HTT6_VITVI
MKAACLGVLTEVVVTAVCLGDPIHACVNAIAPHPPTQDTHNHGGRERERERWQHKEAMCCCCAAL